MSLLVAASEPVDRDVGVDLGRRETGVAEDLLDHAKIRATLEQVGMSAWVTRRGAGLDWSLPTALNLPPVVGCHREGES